MPGYILHGLVGWHGPGVKITLGIVAFHFLKKFNVLMKLYTLGDHIDLEVMGQENN